MSLGFLCAGPEHMAARYGTRAARLNWNRSEYRTASTPSAVARKAVGKVIDAFRTVAWVSRHEAVIVPGMGVLEAEDRPLRPWSTPYSLLLLCAAGRLVNTPVALVNVGADSPSQRSIRWMYATAVRLAHYVSYRDELSRTALQGMGVDTSRHPVYPDVAFFLPEPDPVDDAPERATVGVGLMAYDGGNADRHRSAEIAVRYVDEMTRFVRWLVQSGYQVRLFIGDQDDARVAGQIRAGLTKAGSPIDPSQVSAEPMFSLTELMLQMQHVDAVVATRFHNVLCSLKLGKPTVSVSYAAKNDVLMKSMGLEDFCQFAGSLDGERLIKQFQALQQDQRQIGPRLLTRSAENRRLLARQFTELASVVAARRQPPRMRVLSRLR